MENTNELFRETDIRREKIKNLKAQGVNPYAPKFECSCDITEARKMELGSKVKLGGRVIGKRVMGKLAFIKIADIYNSIQVSIGRNEIEEEKYTFFKQNIDIGDFVGLSGELYVTHTEELTIRCADICLLSKAIKPLPEKFHGLSDQETRYRERYHDLISNENARKILLGRSNVTKFIRNYLQNNGFIEVETPILQSAVSGASAKPFITKHNALDMEMNLRIAPECYLKQCVAGGFPRVFEVAKCFRNEGMDQQHLQEFTQVEWYASYWDFEDNIKFFTGFIRALTQEILGKQEITVGEEVFDISKDFKRVNYTETINGCLGFNVLDYSNVDDLKAKVLELNRFDSKEIDELKTCGAVIDYIYKRDIRPSIKEPTILFNYPASLVPLARPNDADPRTIEMFQFLINGVELCKAYSELVDPFIQRRNLEEQMKAKLAGDDEAMEIDESFLGAMEAGMPPMSGLGMGIDRLLMTLFNVENIREVILFPIMK